MKTKVELNKLKEEVCRHRPAAIGQGCLFNRSDSRIFPELPWQLIFFMKTLGSFNASEGKWWS